MDTEIEFLRRFESELTTRAKADARREASPKPNDAHRWRPWIAGAAALLALSFLVGVLATGGSLTATSSASRSAALQDGAVSEPAIGTGAQGVPAPPAPASNQQGFLGVGQGGVHTNVKGAVTAPEANGSAPATTTSGNGVQQQISASPTTQQSDLSKIVRDGQIAVTIDQGTFKAKAGSVAHIAAVNGGSILSSSTEGGDSGSFTIRVPAANFDKAMVQLTQLGSVDSSATQGQDVTAQYVDLKAHMKIYLSRRRVLFGLMNKATTIGQSLTLQNQLDQVQLKIDQITGQINYINKQVAESTIKVDLHEPGAATSQSPDTVDNPSLGHAWDRAVQGVLNVLAATIIGLGYLIPLLIIAGIVFLVVWLARRRRNVEEA